MKLTTLEVKGFKSFGDRITIHFDQGVTSIVGPNGSGKSNVVDAIRWVLGEQKTRMLRSEKMENIIFNGTKNRKPANMAEVNISFENDKGILPTEYSTVTITRRLYRTGESEYLLNNTPCRLKDINNLFMDTGIGPDSYAIIELKMVDEILNDRNNTIKNLLEEAAGISKYKLRKKQTFARLEDTDADLNRVNDLLFEIEKSMKQLESQARKAQRHQKLKDEYKETSISYACYAVREFKETLQELNQKEQDAQDQKLKLNVDLDVLDAKVQQLKNDSIEKEKQYSEVQKEVNQLMLNLTRSETELKNIRDKVSFLHEKQAQIRKQNETDQDTITDLNEQISLLTEEKASEEETFVTFEQQLSELKANVEENKNQYEESLEELKELNQQIHDIRQEINAHETQAAVRDARSNSIRDEITRLEGQKKTSEQKLEDQKQELDSLVPQREHLKEELGKIRNEKTSIESRLADSEVQIRSLNVKLADEKRNFDVKSNEYNLTRNMIERMEGFPESIKFLKSSESDYRNFPLVSELIDCADEYKSAIENYLEPFLNHFVVNDGDEAWKALHSLNNSEKGRAHFFILDQLRNSEGSGGGRSEISGSVKALSVVDYDDKYADLFRHLLGHVYISQEDEISGTDTAALGKGFVLLSRSGRYLKQKYSVGGGSVGKSDGRRTGGIKQLEKLEKQISEHESEVQKLQADLENAENEHEKLKSALNGNSETAFRNESELAKLEGVVESVNNNMEFLSSGIDITQTTINQLKDELQTLENDEQPSEDIEDGVLASHKAELNNLIEQQKVKQDASNELQHHVSEMTNALNHKNIQYFQQQNKIQNIARDISYKNNQITNLSRNREEQETELEGISAQLASLGEHDKELADQLSDLKEKQHNVETSVEVTEKEYYKSKGLIDSEEQEINNLRKKKENNDNIISGITTEISDFKLKLNSLQERLSIEFSVNLDDLMEMEPDPEKDPGELRDRTELLRSKLTNFGPINPMALESFSEIQERHEFILKEKGDLQEAKESLLKTIAEIDATAKEKYLEAYADVRKNFMEVFRTLFSEEDNCDLILTDLSDPLDSDVQIIAQPKGKKPLSIQQLSGGEKTLTATALLFGIYLLKPSPFCIFDEVDAPLDDANIAKFNKIIQKFSEQSQFIIITHNKKTMAATDIMYGITMVEQGITQVVPVDLREYA